MNLIEALSNEDRRRREEAYRDYFRLLSESGGRADPGAVRLAMDVLGKSTDDVASDLRIVERAKALSPVLAAGKEPDLQEKTVAAVAAVAAHDAETSQIVETRGKARIPLRQRQTELEDVPVQYHDAMGQMRQLKALHPELLADVPL